MQTSLPNSQYINGLPSLSLTQLNYRFDLLSLLQEFDVELNHTLDLKAVLHVALSAAQIVSSADSGWIALFDEGELKINTGFGAHSFTRAVPAKGITERALRCERSEYVPEVAADPDYVAVLPSTRAQMVILLLAHHKIVGLLNLETDSADEFTLDKYEFTLLLAARIATAIENARLYQTSQAQLVELQTLYKEVSALEQLKTDMIRVAAHDLRSPLSIIYSYVDLLDADLAVYMNDLHRSAVSAIRRAVGRIESMSSDILTLERLQSNSAPPDDIVPLVMLAKVALEDHRYESDAKRQKVILTHSADAIFVTGDQGQLREAINNLVGNAIKYTPEGGCIQVRAFIEQTCGVLEVEDNGYGIPEADQPRIFEPFFRAKTGETRDIEGTGLGLYLVKKIVERHKGQIIWRSAYQAGSTFGFRLPLFQ